MQYLEVEEGGRVDKGEGWIMRGREGCRPSFFPSAGRARRAASQDVFELCMVLRPPSQSQRLNHHANHVAFDPSLS